MIGTAGEVLECSGSVGWALVDGERWQVRATTALHPGQRVRVTRVDGLTLEVSQDSESTTQGAPS
jgi:membrane-bound serine protease (ClpP class)